MSIQNFFKSLISTSTRGRPARRLPLTSRPRLEPLEDRCLLSANGAISGRLLEDLTGNGVSPDDRAIAHRSVSLFRDDGDGLLNPNLDTRVGRQKTDHRGRYAFHHLPAGSYFVQQALPRGWVQIVAEEHEHDEVLRPEECGPTPPERNDTLAMAIATGLSSGMPGTLVARGVIGDNDQVAPHLDVDLFRLRVNAGDRIRADADAAAFGSPLDGILRIFKANGIQVAGNDGFGDGVVDPHLEFVARASGTYYVGVSAFANADYDPTLEASGTLPPFSGGGEYTIQIEVGPRPKAEPLLLTLGQDEQRRDVDDASCRLGSIRGQMFKDKDGDGKQDANHPGLDGRLVGGRVGKLRAGLPHANEPGLDGRLVVLTHDGAFLSFTTTRSIDLNHDGRINRVTESGLYSFNDLRPGTYFTSGLIPFGLGPPDWIQTSPSFEPSPEFIGEVPSAPGSDPGVGLVPDLTVDLASGLANWFIADGVLHFGQATPNIGLGPMELRAGPVLADGTQLVSQRIYQDTELNTFIDRDAGTFNFHPEHNHTHFDDFVQFAVRQALTDGDGDGRPDVGAIVAGGAKTSFCLIDAAPYDLTLPNAAPQPSGFNCAEVQRISVGWMDVYGPTTSGQQIDLSGLAPGQYWLEAVVDPSNRLLESNETNNTGRILITVGLGAPNAPVAYHGVVLRSGRVARHRDFGNFQLISINGRAFHDRDRDGRQDRGENGLEGWTVFLDLNGDGILNNPEGDNIASGLAAEPWALTDADGNYVLAGVGPGTHLVREIPASSWLRTTRNPRVVKALSGHDVFGVNFGNS